MPAIPLRTLPARTAVALEVKKDETIKVINTHGKQVVSFWAVQHDGKNEYLSPAHTHGVSGKIGLKAGDLIYTNSSNPGAILVEDTSPGVHDTLVSACDAGKYRSLGAQDGHPSCANNFRRAYEQLDLNSAHAIYDHPPPPSINFFMNASIGDDQKLHIAQPSSGKGQYVSIKLLFDAIVVLSACPMDLDSTNDFNPTDIQYIILK